MNAARGRDSSYTNGRDFMLSVEWEQQLRIKCLFFFLNIEISPIGVDVQKNFFF